MKRKKSEQFKEALNQTFLYKKADDDVNANIAELVNEEAFAQLSKKYSDIIPYIIGFKEVEKIDDGTLLSSAVVSDGENRLIIPIIYAGGKVDATSYIYNPDTDIIFALTKKVINFLFKTNKDLGVAIDGQNNSTLDAGNIRKLFIPPKNWSPKIASSNLLPYLVETQPIIKGLLLEKIATDETFSQIFKIFYHDMAEELEKEAQQFKAFIETPEIVASSFEEVRHNNNVLNKEAAAQEYAENGIYIQHGEKLPSKSLIKVASGDAPIKQALNSDDIEIVGKKSGCFKVVNSSNLTVDFVLSLPLFKGGPKNYILDFLGSEYYNDYFDFIGKEDENCFAAKTNLMEVSPQNLLSHLPNVVIVLMQNQTRFLGFIPVIKKNLTENNIQLIYSNSNTIVINVSYGRIKRIVVEKNSDKNPMEVGNVLIVGDKNIGLYLTDKDPRKYMTYDEYVARTKYNTNSSTEIIKVAYDGSHYVFNNRLLTQKELASFLLKEGFDKYSIYSLLKEAKSNGEAEAKAISAKIDTLAQLIATTLGELKKLEGKVEALTQGTQFVENNDLYQYTEPIASEDNYNESETTQESPQLDEQTAAAIQMDAMNAPQQDVPTFSMYDEGKQIEDIPEEPGIEYPQAQTEEDASQENQGLVNGMNPLANPDVIQMLVSLKDTPIMDVSILTLLLANKNVSLVIQDQLANILNGINGLGKITFNVQLNYTSLSESMGDNRYKSVLNNLKSLFKNMTDLYVDLVQKSEQFKTQEEDEE